MIRIGMCPAGSNVERPGVNLTRGKGSCVVRRVPRQLAAPRRGTDAQHVKLQLTHVASAPDIPTTQCPFLVKRPESNPTSNPLLRLWDKITNLIPDLSEMRYYEYWQETLNNRSEVIQAIILGGFNPSLGPNTLSYITGNIESSRAVLKDMKTFGTFLGDAAPGLLGKSSLFVTSDSTHKQKRALLLPFFQPAALVKYRSKMQALTSDIAQQLFTACETSNNPQNVETAMQTLVFETLSSILMGIDFGDEQNQQLRDDSDIILEGLADVLGIDLPFTPVGRAKEARKRVEHVLNLQIEKILLDVEAGRTPPPGLFSELLLTKDANGQPVLNSIELMDMYITLLFAAREGTSASFTSLLYYITKQPDVWQQLAAEQAELRAKYGNDITKDVLQGMQYAEYCIQEGLRVSGTIGALFRQATTDTFIEGHPVRKGQFVAVPVPWLHMNDPRWVNANGTLAPNRFNPVRFATTPYQKGQPSRPTSAADQPAMNAAAADPTQTSQHTTVNAADSSTQPVDCLASVGLDVAGGRSGKEEVVELAHDRQESLAHVESAGTPGKEEVAAFTNGSQEGTGNVAGGAHGKGEVVGALTNERQESWQLSFGYGPRACLGAALYMQMAKVLLAVLARDYTLTLAEEPKWCKRVLAPRTQDGLRCWVEKGECAALPTQL